MASLVGVFATGHAPNLVTTWDRAGDAVCQEALAAFHEMAGRIKAAAATTVITISNDHFNNFYLNNLPAYAIGVGERWIGPEDDLGYEGGPIQIAGNPTLGLHLVEHLYQHEGFDPAVSYHLKLDHGTFVPMRYTFPEFELPLIPTFQNCVQQPMPTIKRAAAFGAALRRGIESAPTDDRVIIVGAGGMSHFIGVPGQGRINEEFDRRWVDLFAAGDLEALTNLGDDEVAAGGNGAQEIRNWVAAMGAAGGRPAEWLMYRAVPAWLIGMGVVDFRYS
ncbi:MAG: 2,3-dihydroxyphenylpropionate 1,2-dioxygenase [Chloroflexi bacterium]|nr:2,3-dihydroxyphenylpropionate 1,2-dioxygenase [Chloroflexota bacterium]